MKKLVFALVMLLLCACILGTASASTFDRSFSELRRIVRSNAGDRFNATIQDEDGKDEQGVVFATDASGEVAVAGYFRLTGNKDSIIEFKVFVDPSLGADRRNEMLEFCNTWNYERRYPTVYLLKDEVSFIANGFLMTTADCTSDMVDEFANDMVFGTRMLLTEMQDKQVIPSDWKVE